jgi:acylglycerol lipase
MAHHTFSINQDNYSYFAQSWEPDQPKASLIIVHGQSDHSSRYAHVAEYLNELDIAVVGFDLFGHGKSEGKRGHVPHYDVYVESLAAALEWTQNKFPNMPTFIMGHSMGGNIVANFVLKRKPEIRGTILSSPYLRLAFKPSNFQLMLAKVGKSLMPSLTQPTKLDPKGISRDAAKVKAYEDDPMVHGMISPISFLGVSDSGEWIINHAHEWEGSLLVFQGTADPVTSIEASKEFVKNIESHNQDIQFKEWEGMLHETLNDTERDKVIAFLGDWIKERM